jgi:hypothetical protein
MNEQDHVSGWWVAAASVVPGLVVLGLTLLQ